MYKKTSIYYSGIEVNIMADKKSGLLALLEVLEEETDENHILSTKELNDLLYRRYDIQLERRTLYANIRMLNDFGYEVSSYEQNGKGYYLSGRKFEKSEILLLCNAIHASNFIPQKHSQDLIDKLLKARSKYEQSEYKNTVYLKNKKKTENVQFLYNIDNISIAIKNKHNIEFTYLQYDKNKKLVPRREEPYVVEPRYIVYAESKAYLITTSTHHEGFAHYRIDRIKDIHELETRSRPLPKNYDPYEYANNKLFMFSGENVAVLIKFDKNILDQMIDLFGKDINIVDGGSYYTMRVHASKYGIIYLAQQYLDSMEIIEPEDIREEIYNNIKTGLERYKKRSD